MTENPNGKNVVSLAEARKRQKTVRVDVGGRKLKDKGAGPKVKGGKIWQYVQLLAFLVLIAVLMRLCSGRGF